jgi:mono/diheme cytochrome c family protein
MQGEQPGRVAFAAIISTALMSATPAVAGENKFVFVPRADSPGSDLLRVDNSSFEDCVRRCDAESDCNAFTYNQRHDACFLKRSVNRDIAFYAFAITGVKLSRSGPVTATQNDTGSDFVIMPRADSPGNDYFKVTLFTFEECQHSCEADKECNAFTYNQARSVCLFKRAANQWISFHAWASTGIKLSSMEPKASTTAPVQAPTPSGEQAEAPGSPTAPAEPRIATPSEQAQPPRSAAESDGKAILQNNCGGCHSLGASGESPLPQAPPLRKVYLKYPIDQLEEGFAEGMGSKHRGMPQIQFSPDQIAAILNYLGSITGVDPATRARVVIPGETPP